MKSRLIVALAMAMSLMTVNAAAQNVTPNDLVGKWTTSEHEADDAGEIEMPGILKTMLLKPVMNEMKKEMKKTQQFRINSVSDTELKMISITEKDATEDVYTRVK